MFYKAVTISSHLARCATVVPLLSYVPNLPDTALWLGAHAHTLPPPSASPFPYVFRIKARTFFTVYQCERSRLHRLERLVHQKSPSTQPEC